MKEECCFFSDVLSMIHFKCFLCTYQDRTKQFMYLGIMKNTCFCM